MSSFSTYLVRFKDTVSDFDYKKAIDDVKAKGGAVLHENTLYKGFVAKLPDDHVSALESHPSVDGVEKDSEVRTQHSQ